jgi:hypothetical protein
MGATDALIWQQAILSPGEEIALAQPAQGLAVVENLGWEEMTRREAAVFGDADGILFKRYGPAMLWGHWNAERNWEWNAMPLALRFVIANTTGKDWSACSVEMDCPKGWQAQGRQPRHWTQPEAMKAGVILLELGSLANDSRTVAAFWLRPHPDFRLRIQWDDPNRPFHEPSQPGDGWLLRTPDIDAPFEVKMQARLSVTTSQGEEIHRTLIIPVNIIPYCE